MAAIKPQMKLIAARPKSGRFCLQSWRTASGEYADSGSRRYAIKADDVQDAIAYFTKHIRCNRKFVHCDPSNYLTLIAALWGSKTRFTTVNF